MYTVLPSTGQSRCLQFPNTLSVWLSCFKKFSVKDLKRGSSGPKKNTSMAACQYFSLSFSFSLSLLLSLLSRCPSWPCMTTSPPSQADDDDNNNKHTFFICFDSANL